jgi:choline kinase
LERVGYQELCGLMTDVIAYDGGLRACDVTGAFWFDVDTPDDLAAVRQLFSADATAIV